MYRRILVLIDGSPTSRQALREAIRMAEMTQARLRLVHVIDDLSFALCMESHGGQRNDWLGELRAAGTRILEEAKAIVEASNIEVEAVLHDSFSGVFHELVAAEAGLWTAELIVIGAHGRRGAGRAKLGSGATRIVQHAAVPVLLVRGVPAKASSDGHREALARHRIPMGVASLS